MNCTSLLSITKQYDKYSSNSKGNDLCRLQKHYARHEGIKQYPEMILTYIHAPLHGNLFYLIQMVRKGPLGCKQTFKFNLFEL